MFIGTLNHKSHGKCKVQRSAGLRQDWNTVAEQGLDLPCALPSPSLCWPSTNSICGNIQPWWRHIPTGVSGVSWVLWSPIHWDYPAMSGFAPKAMTLLAVKLNITPSDKIYSLLIGHFIRYTLLVLGLDPLLPYFFVLQKGAANIPQIYKHFMYNKHFYGIFYHIYKHYIITWYYTLYLHYKYTLDFHLI